MTKNVPDTVLFNHVAFMGSFDREAACPKEEVPEFAFIGRSNVGKSSLINMITGRKEIAKVSKQPGKTQLINFFNVDNRWHLVDLPGYGYAKISKSQRLKWEQMIERYFVMRRQLVCAFVLIDCRHPLQKLDLEFINFLGERVIPFAIVFTKFDKLNATEQSKNIDIIKEGLLEHWEELPPQFVTSSETRYGREEIIGYIEQLTEKY